MQAIITDSVDIYRLEKDGSTQSYSDEPVFEKVECGIFPAGTDIVAVYPSIEAYQLYEIFVYEDIDLHNGDKLTTDSREYILQGVPQRYDNKYTHFARIVGQLVV